MELLLINHPLDCPVCDKGGECPLQNQAMSNGRAESRFVDVKRTYPKPLPIRSAGAARPRALRALRPLHPLLRSRSPATRSSSCSSAARWSRSAIYEDEPFESYFSGNTVQICPVGALTGAAVPLPRPPVRPASATPSVCEHCASGCALRTDYRRGKVLRRLAGDDPAVNEEWNCDKGRWAFRYATPDRPAHHAAGPRARRRAASRVLARGLGARPRPACAAARDAGGVGVLPGGRLTVEDAYAYAKFARVALGTNDVDFRARAALGRGAGLPRRARRRHATPASRRGHLRRPRARARPCCSSGSSRRRSRRSSSCGCARPCAQRGPPVFDARAVRARRAAEKLAGDAAAHRARRRGARRCARSPTAAGGGAGEAPPRCAAARRRRPRRRAAGRGRPARCPPLSALAAATGARLAWVPRRAGERGAVEAGALPDPAARRPRRSPTPAARAEVAARLGRRRCPAHPGRDTTGILTAARDGELGGAAGRRRRPRRPARPRARRAPRWPRPASWSAWSCAARAVTDARRRRPAGRRRRSEKAGTLPRLGGPRPPVRRRPCTAPAQLTDARVLHGLADEMDVALRPARRRDAARAELAALGVGRDRAPAAPRRRRPAAAARPAPARRVLATWRQLLDAGTLQDDEPTWPAPPRAAVAPVGADTAAELGRRRRRPGHRVGTDAARSPCRCVVTDMPDRVVWLPTRSPGSRGPRATSRAGPGAVVRLALAAPRMHPTTVRRSRS